MLGKRRRVAPIAAAIVLLSVGLQSCEAGGGGPIPVPEGDCDPAGIVIVEDSSGRKWRWIRSHGEPDYEPTFPECPPGPAGPVPTKVEPQCYLFVIPYREEGKLVAVTPDSPVELVDLDAPDFLERPPRFGVATNGVVFDPVTNDFYNPNTENKRSQPGPGQPPGLNKYWRYNACDPVMRERFCLDSHNAHVQKDGAYHYHGGPDIGGDARSELIGWAFDGFPIYGEACERSGPGTPGAPVATIRTRPRSGYKLHATRPDDPDGFSPPPVKDGTSLPLGVFDRDYKYEGGDLDECNGHQSSTPEYPGGIYHYHVTQEFPGVPRCHILSPAAE